MLATNEYEDDTQETRLSRLYAEFYKKKDVVFEREELDADSDTDEEKAVINVSAKQPLHSAAQNTNDTYHTYRLEENGLFKYMYKT
jgi:hypothetical protein